MRTLTVLAPWGLLASVAAASPVDLTHSGRLLDPSGGALNGPHTLAVTLWSDAVGTASAQQLWTASYPGVILQDGFYSLTLSAVDSADLAAPTWIGLAIDGGAPLSPRQALTQVPTAAVATTATHLPLAAVTNTACTDVGAIVYDTTVAKVRVCDGTTWQLLGSVLVAESGGVKRWADGGAAKSCEAYRRPAAPYAYSGATGDGLYVIDPDGAGLTYGETTVYCDQTHHDGGWTLALSAGFNRDLTLAGVENESLPLPASAGDPGNGVLHKMSDTMINAVRTRTGTDIAYWMTTPGMGTGTLGAEIFYRGDCAFHLRQSEAAIRATTCDEWTITYSSAPTWSPGGHWWSGNAAYISAFAHGNAEVLGTQSVCHQDGTGLGIHSGIYAPFHRGWCSVHGWGQIWVR